MTQAMTSKLCIAAALSAFPMILFVGSVAPYAVAADNSVREFPAAMKKRSAI